MKWKTWKKDGIDDAENQELDVYNDQPLNDVDGIAINLPSNWNQCII